jgi:hypothetical protein
MEKVLTDAYMAINDTPTAGQTSVAISASAEALDSSSMGDAYRKRIGGVKDWGFASEFNATAELATTLFGMIGQVVTIEARPTSEAISATNPAFKGPVVVTECNPLDGQFGEVWKITLTGQGAGNLELLTVAPV